MKNDSCRHTGRSVLVCTFLPVPVRRKPYRLQSCNSYDTYRRRSHKDVVAAFNSSNEKRSQSDLTFFEYMRNANNVKLIATDSLTSGHMWRKFLKTGGILYHFVLNESNRKLVTSFKALSTTH